MNEAVMRLPHSSQTCRSKSAAATPCAKPPRTWPSASIGLSSVPASWTVT